MKQYKRILEAIQKGLNFALDDLNLEDNEGDFSLSKQQYKTKSMKQEYIENQFIDLGLPSGTLWCKYNLGCDFALLSSKPESTSPKDWYGKYYAWGETEEKDYYGQKSYKFGKIISDKDYNFRNYNFKDYNFIKYCPKSNYGYNGFTDDLAKLLPEDDVAYQTNSNWKMPTKEQCQELLDYTTIKWISGKDNNLHMNVEGLVGVSFTSKTNGNQIFIPAAGCKEWSSLSGEGSYGGLWSSSLNTDDPDYAWNLYFQSDGIGMSYYNRYHGQSIRPVLNKNN